MSHSTRILGAGLAVVAAALFVALGMEFIAFAILFAGAWQLYPLVNKARQGEDIVITEPDNYYGYPERRN